MGSPEQVAEFRRRLELPFTCLSDPERTAYQAYGLARGSLKQIAGPKVWLKGLKALLRRGAGRPAGDIMQMPGAFVIDTAGRLRLAHRSADSGDLPTVGELLSAVERIPRSANSKHDEDR
jgi:peroxiredoxin